MPNRILRDWTDSEMVDLLSVHAERFFTRLIMKVDDYGRYSANIKIIKSLLFPLKTDIREADVSRWLAECQKAGLIALYSVASKDYLQIENFKQALRQKQEKYPAPQTSSRCDADATQMNSTCVPETKGNESEVETRNEEVPPPTDFVTQLRTDQKYFENLAMAWSITKSVYDELVTAFNLSLVSNNKVHPTFPEYKSHFFNWAAMKYESFKNKSKSDFETKLRNVS